MPADLSSITLPLAENALVFIAVYPSLISEIMSHGDPLQIKMETLRYKIGKDKLGKTDKYSKEEAKTHIDTAKQMMQMKHPKRGGIWDKGFIYKGFPLIHYRISYGDTSLA